MIFCRHLRKCRDHPALRAPSSQAMKENICGPVPLLIVKSHVIPLNNIAAFIQTAAVNIHRLAAVPRDNLEVPAATYGRKLAQLLLGGNPLRAPIPGFAGRKPDGVDHHARALYPLDESLERRVRMRVRRLIVSIAQEH